jgi:Phytanoyl-CoA dioxygenase (PhyH)
MSMPRTRPEDIGIRPAERDPAVPGRVRDVTPQEIAFFDAQGWALLPDFVVGGFTTDLAAEARRLMGERAELGKDQAEPFSTIWRTYDEPSHRSPLLWDFATSPAVGRVGSRLLRERPVRFLRDEVYVKMTAAEGEGAPTPWHQDFPYGNRDRSGQVNIWIALDDVAVDGGALRYLSGSHRWGVLGRALGDPADDLLHQYPELDALPRSPVVPLYRGDALVHHGLTVHSAPANASDRIRWAYTVVLFQADARFTGVPWPSRLADTMGALQVNEPFDHPLTPVVWPQAGLSGRTSRPS